MIGLKDAFSKLTDLRRHLEDALQEAGAAQGTPVFGAASKNLVEVGGFGSNPGRLRMFTHVPANLPRRPALVVGLHGCTQTAAAYDSGSGWSTLAERAGFIALFPEQQPTNNPNRCFNWFSPQQTRRDGAETLSIHQMISYAVSAYNVDSTQIFVTGLSAGGAMASSLLANYPDLFAAGAIVAGLPHGSASNLTEALEAMSKGRSQTPRQWGDAVRSASFHPGRWPRVSVWHGTRDNIVNPANAEASVAQWADVHGVASAPASERFDGGQRIRTWKDTGGAAVLEAHTIEGMGHGVPIALTGDNRCGNAGPFHFDVGIASSAEIVGFFGLPLEAPARAEAPAAQASQAPRGAAPQRPHEPAAELRDGIFEVLRKAGVMNHSVTGRRRDPPLSAKVHKIIDSALQAAGLSKKP
jgi:poly(hydroxyalkanoate) depolymerase family esterase